MTTTGHTPPPPFEVRGCPSATRTYKAAFTLIELLVVIAIIAIIAAILFPVFSQAKAAAKKASCLSNVKQLGLAYMMYADDYDQIGCIQEYGRRDPSNINIANVWAWDFYAQVNTVSSPSLLINSSQGLLQPYIKNGQLFACPTAPPSAYTAQNPSYYLGGITDNYYSGYGLNAADAMYPRGTEERL
jgi:prepilin-type N-terminal cleavage/methylation domain-containing protein